MVESTQMHNLSTEIQLFRHCLRDVVRRCRPGGPAGGALNVFMVAHIPAQRFSVAQWQ